MSEGGFMMTAMLVSFLASSVAFAPAAGIASRGAEAVGARAGEGGVAVARAVQAADRARVHVHVRDDSYLVVLYASPDGHVRMLYPIYPHDDDFVKAGTDFD